MLIETYPLKVITGGYFRVMTYYFLSKSHFFPTKTANEYTEFKLERNNITLSFVSRNHAILEDL